MNKSWQSREMTAFIETVANMIFEAEEQIQGYEEPRATELYAAIWDGNCELLCRRLVKLGYVNYDEKTNKYYLIER